MGRPKLILDVGGRTVIARVVSALREGGASPVLVVSPPAGSPGASVLRAEAEAAGADVLVPATRPHDMRASVEHALDHLGRLDRAPEAVLLAPADSPGISPALVRLVVERARAEPSRAVVPVSEGRRGHPIALPWAFVPEIRALPDGVGVNALFTLRAGIVDLLEVSDPGAVGDLDTPEDYARWCGPGGL